jgi:hypothetical protein
MVDGEHSRRYNLLCAGVKEPGLRPPCPAASRVSCCRRIEHRRVCSHRGGREGDVCDAHTQQQIESVGILARHLCPRRQVVEPFSLSVVVAQLLAIAR